MDTIKERAKTFAKTKLASDIFSHLEISGLDKEKLIENLTNFLEFALSSQIDLDIVKAKCCLRVYGDLGNCSDKQVEDMIVIMENFLRNNLLQILQR